MAFHDPYKTNNDSYYNPASSSSDDSAQSAGAALKSMVYNMAGFAITHAVLSKAIGVGSKALTKTIAAGARNELRTVAASEMPAARKVMLERTEAASSLGEIAAARSRTVDRIYSTYKNKTADVEHIVSARKAEIARLKETSPIDAGKYRVTSAFKDVKTFKAVAWHNIQHNVLAG